MFLGSDPQSESVMNELGYRKSVDHFFHECQTEMAVLQQGEASLQIDKRHTELIRLLIKQCPTPSQQITIPQCTRQIDRQTDRPTNRQMVQAT